MKQSHDPCTKLEGSPSYSLWLMVFFINYKAKDSLELNLCSHDFMDKLFFFSSRKEAVCPYFLVGLL